MHVAGVCLGEDRRRRFTTQLLDGEPYVLARAQHRLALLDERSDQRPQLVQCRPAPLDVLFEGERELGALLELPPEDDEGSEDESAQEWVEMRRANGHASRYAASGASPASDRQ